MFCKITRTSSLYGTNLIYGEMKNYRCFYQELNRIHQIRQDNKRIKQILAEDREELCGRIRKK